MKPLTEEVFIGLFNRNKELIDAVWITPEEENSPEYDNELQNFLKQGYRNITKEQYEEYINRINKI